MASPDSRCLHDPGEPEVGGASVAASIIAAVYALAGNANSVTFGAHRYSHTGSL